ASLDLGWLPAAETQARAAFLWAELAGNNALRAWVRGTQSLIAYWDDRPRDAVELAEDGWRYVPENGTSRVRLAAIAARAYGRMRDGTSTEATLRRAERARDEVSGEDDPEGAAEQIPEVLAVARRRRTDSVVRRLRQLASALQRPRFESATLALDLRDEIVSFCETPQGSALPERAR